MDYTQIDNEKLKTLATWLKHDSNHMGSPDQRQQAKVELRLVEAELKSRSGLQGLVRNWKKMIKG